MTAPGQDSPQDLAAAYALGALSADEARRFEAFLAVSPETQREVREYREVAALLALDGPEGAGSLPGGLRDRVLERVAEQKNRALRPMARGQAPRPSSVVWVALAATLLLAVGLGAGLVSVRGRVAALQGELAARNATLDRTAQQLAERDATLNSILEPGVELYQLTSSGDPEPGIQLFWNRQRNQAIVHGFRLKPVPSGKAYQLWFIKDGAPIPSVTFKPEPDGHAEVEHVTVPGAGVLSAAAVTVEPEAGSAQPTSPVVLLGPLKRS
ncbi:MAG TPA: anti-sigma factor [Gemmatimonadales bacterium]|nr:anti-sigma factor [Gemmatimonadales bacterium]